MGKGNDGQEQLVKLSDTLKSGDMREFKFLYTSLKEPFHVFSRKYTSDEDVLADVYHDTFLVLYENIVQDKITEMTSSMKTYIFSIGKYTLFNALKKKIKHASLMEDKLPEPEMTYQIETEEPTEVQILFRKHFRQLGESCRELLKLFYYENLSIRIIMDRMNYKNANTVKAHKSRCMKKLREAMDYGHSE